MHEPGEQSNTAWAGLIPAAALLAALLLGGGGSPAPGFELVLQILAAVLFAAWIIADARPIGQRVHARAMLLAVLVVALPLAQLVPLPPALWQALPGRAIERDALALLDLDSGWRSWSMAPDRTLAALLAALPPLALLWMTAAADRRGRRALVLTVALAALLTALLGALQLSSGSGSIFRFHVPLSQSLDGFQANRNSTADMFLIGLVATAGAVRLTMGRRWGLVVFAGAVMVFSLGVVLTTSRAGVVLLPLAWLGGAMALGSWLRLPRGRLLAGVLAGLAMAGLASAALSSNAAVGRVIDRFGTDQELRPDLWRDSLYVARQHMPFGVGLGNFVPAMIAGERLEAVRPNLPNRAHNEVLELAVEGGIFALALLLAGAGLLVSAARRAWRDPPGKEPALVVFALSGLVLLALHSLVDYPFRSMALASLGAVCAGLLLPRPPGRIHAGTPAKPDTNT